MICAPSGPRVDTRVTRWRGTDWKFERGVGFGRHPVFVPSSRFGEAERGLRFEQGDVGSYAREMRRSHGATGSFVARQVARALGGDLLPALFPLNDRLLERSLAVARWLNHEGRLPIHGIDLDLNPDPATGSHRLHSAAVGFVKAHGYEPRTKPDLLMATWAANLLCNRAGRTHETPHRAEP